MAAEVPLTQISTVFDAHHPPAPELIRECVHCGFCLAACPTYLLWHEEMDSPRGRIYLMKMASEGKIDHMDSSFVAHFDRCLGCMACMPACPSGVQYDKLVEATRAQIERNYERGFIDRIHRKLIFSLFPYPGRLRIAALFLWLYVNTGMRWLVHAVGLTRLLPARLQEMEALLPPVTLRAITSQMPPRIAALGGSRKRVGLILGCVQRVFFDEVNRATARVLAAEGCEVIVPDQGCCGALMTHTGREEEAISAARKMIDAFAPLDLDYIVVNAAGCGSNLKEYGHLLRDDPVYAARANVFAAKCRDVSEVLAELAPRAKRHPLRMRVAYHDSCHLAQAQGIQKEPRELLEQIPELQLVELLEPTTCCGSAGVYNLLEPKTAHELGERKARHVARSKADVLVSANPGCLLQISKELKQTGQEIPTFHLIELVDAAIRGVRPGKEVRS